MTSTKTNANICKDLRAETNRFGPVNRFLSREECTELGATVATMGRGGGTTDVWINTSWTGNHRWSRNQITTSGDTRNNVVFVGRHLRGATAFGVTNQIETIALEATVRRTERLLIQEREQLDSGYIPPSVGPYPEPKLFFEDTYALQSAERAEVMHALIKPATEAGMFAAGFLQVSAGGDAIVGVHGLASYIPVTTAQYSVTVRDPDGTGSGWAGVDWNDWRRVNAAELSAIALDKCLRSRNPMAIEPGRYRTILEPQAVADFVAPMFDSEAQLAGVLSRMANEQQYGLPFQGAQKGDTKIGQRVMDARLTINADPMDPDLGFSPVGVSMSFGGDTPFGLDVVSPVTWIERGVLKTLAYRRAWAMQNLLLDHAVAETGVFRISGGTTSVDDMIANTARGIIVTRFWNVQLAHVPSLTCTGWTRDGLWLIEHGKIRKPIRNFRFTQSILAALNNVEEIGVSQRVFRPAKPALLARNMFVASQPVVAPPLAITDFNFTALTGAV